jgi:MOSC domain-containing protein YiiM
MKSGPIDNVRPGAGAMTFQGVVAGVFLAAKPREAMDSPDEVTVVVGQGIAGDRYAGGAGTFSTTPGTGRQVTLIEQEAVDAAGREYGVAIEGRDTRRNIMTIGVPLNHLVGRRFSVGDVVLAGMRLAEPCAHLESLTRPGVRGALIHRGGLRADVVRGGTIRVGDPIVPLPDESDEGDGPGV